MEIHKIPKSDYDAVAVSLLKHQFIKLQQKKNKITVALSGGNTPLPILAELAKENLSWEKFHFFMVDERCVSIDDAQSNFGNIKKIFFDNVSSSCYSMVDEKFTFDESIKEYEDLLLKEVELDKEVPVFDLIVLGMGEDGHVASLFPETIALSEQKRIVVRNNVPQLNMDRITLTYPVLLNAKETMIMIKGKKKRQVFEQMYKNGKTNFPMQRIVDQKRNISWIIERE
ncbi:6-phosphogluconolactonase [Aquimarina hainanensis]|uniref:6-phosphogluconolactonase n=1 Tax=Aquimarina hainanensis TaxID=1578017 RepID=A0ABW5N3U3_9FLAO